MNRILEATVDLLEEKNFEELTIAEIVEKADCSVGAFYGRFKDKTALLHALDERYFQEYAALAENLLTEQGAAMSLQESVRTIMQALVSMHREKRGLRRTLILKARLDDDPSFRQREQDTWRLVPKLADYLLRFKAQIKHPQPRLALEFGFMQAYYAMREMVLWDHIAAHIPLSGDDLAEELTQAYLAYLGIPVYS